MSTAFQPARAGAAAVLSAAAIISALPSAAPANAVACNDIEVVFARGTSELPGIGRVGQAFKRLQQDRQEACLKQVRLEVLKETRARAPVKNRL